MMGIIQAGNKEPLKFVAKETNVLKKLYLTPHLQIHPLQN